MRAKLPIIMNKINFYLTTILCVIALWSCTPDEDEKAPPPKPFGEQYTKDLEAIETYLKKHSFSVVEVDNRIDVVIDTFIVGNAEGKVSIWDNTQYPLKWKMVKNDSRVSNLVNGTSTDTLEYKMYYFVINEGGGKATTRFDSTYVSYRGWRLDNKQFDISNTPIWSSFPRITPDEVTLISGFRRFSSLLKASESIAVGSDGEVNFNNYGVGVVFLPSGLGYYNASQLNIPAYSPLVFTIRLHSVRDRDHDRDGILSKFENGNNEEDLYSVDTDNDNIPDFLDLDDDNDNVRTLLEIKNPATNKPFPFAEIPNCPGGSLKKHLDPTCQ